MKYLIGAIIGGVLGYLVIFRLIGCPAGSCWISGNPYISVIYGAALGLLVAGMITLPAKNQPAGVSGGEQTSTPGSETLLTKAEYKKLTAEAAKARIDSGDEVIVVDVRTEKEYAAGHIEGAILIPNETITDKRPEQLPDLDAEILIYCRSGRRSAEAAKKLIAMGYKRVYDFGGIIDWSYGIVTG
ncbi:MAG: rhodanese-like domain-containing protein [Eubacteriales bacterium]|jgi:phage shock protein E